MNTIASSILSPPDPPPLPRTTRRRRRLVARHERHDVVGPHGGAGRAEAGADRPPAKAKVLVLGAGLSGLVVGYELGKLGYDYQMLEARDRVGGLQWTVRKGTEHTEIGGERQVCTFDEGQYVNVGPWRIPYSHTGVLNYCQELGVPAAGVPQRGRRATTSTTKATPPARCRTSACGCAR